MYCTGCDIPMTVIGESEGRLTIVTWKCPICGSRDTETREVSL